MNRTVITGEPVRPGNCPMGMTTLEQPFETCESEIRVAQKLHAEDIVIGDYVAISQMVCQFPSFCWCPADTTLLPPEEPVRVVLLPGLDVEALKVVSTCLPFVLCELANGKRLIHDVRQVQLVRLDRDFAKSARATVKKSRKRKSRKSGK